ncbi:MAG: hypothetical protein QG549_850 [Patescibacteria group bacterium]|nr:hypothetical protein [Patescibacteria group bacterium]
MDPNQQPVQPTPPPQPAMPQTPSSYTAPVQEYDPNYLDSIAPPPQQGKFLSGTFGKVFWILVGVFVLAVSFIIAFSGKDETADLQQVSVRLDNFSKTAKTVQKNLKSKTLTSNNGNFQLWLVGNQTAGEELLKKGGVSKTEYNKTMVKSEKKFASDLDAKFEDARLSARLNRVYASTMAAETQKIINILNSMAKKNKSKQIRDYASNASANLVPIQKIFDDYTETAN